MTLETERIRVLVVDDHAVVRRGLVAFLEGEPDLELVGDADGGIRALELLADFDAQERLPDVVLMDLQMAPPDGIAVTREIRARYRDVEVVALTSFGEEVPRARRARRRRGRISPQRRRGRRGGLGDPRSSSWRAPARSRHRTRV